MIGRENQDYKNQSPLKSSHSVSFPKKMARGGAVSGAIVGGFGAGILGYFSRISFGGKSASKSEIAAMSVCVVATSAVAGAALGFFSGKVIKVCAPVIKKGAENIIKKL